MILKYFTTKEDFVKSLVAIYKLIQEQFVQCPSSHSLEHTIRVAELSLSLALEIGANVDIVVIAALLHDIAREKEKLTGSCHAEEGAKMAKDILEKMHLTVMIPDICDAILSHRFSKNLTPSSIEGKILRDADMLDALGTIGLYRVIHYGIEHNKNLNEIIEHFYSKLLKLEHLMHFESSKKMAQERTLFLRIFVEGINDSLITSDFHSLLKQLEDR